MRSTEEIIHNQIQRYEVTKKVQKTAESKSGPDNLTEIDQAFQHPPICISRLLGSGARILARMLQDRLNYIVFGKDIIDEVAKDLNVQRILIDSLDETTRNNFELMLESSLRGREIDRQEYQFSLYRVIQALGAQGGVVFLGRGANCILKEKSALNIFMSADLDIRIKRVMEYDRLNEDEAKNKIHNFDRNRENFQNALMRNISGDNCDYDLQINTTRIKPEITIELVFKSLELRGYNPGKMKMPVIEK